MTNLVTTQLGGESRPALRPQRSSEYGGTSYFNPSFTGQGTEVTSAVEANGILGIENRESLADLRMDDPQGFSIFHILPASIRQAGAASVVNENLSRPELAGGIEINFDLGAIVGTTNSGSFLTPIMASTAIKGSACWLVGSLTPGLSRSRSNYWISPIEENFEFREREKVTRFLKENDFLISLIMEGYEKIKAEFGGGCRLILELINDSESDHDEELFLLIRTTLSAQEASKCLERLDERWWLRASRNARCKLNIDFELA